MSKPDIQPSLARGKHKQQKEGPSADGWRFLHATQAGDISATILMNKRKKVAIAKHRVADKKMKAKVKAQHAADGTTATAPVKRA